MRLLISDTSVLLNLLAAECLDAVTKEAGLHFTICTAVRDEVKKLRNPETGQVEPVDITSHIRSGLLTVLDVETEEEKILYVEQTAVVDDGEAMSIAIAARRNLELAIDDRSAKNHILREFPSIKIWTTPEILKIWSDTGSLSLSRLSTVINLIETRARYFPAKDHPLAAWWDGMKHYF